MIKRKTVLFLLLVTVLSPIVLYTDTLGRSFKTSFCEFPSRNPIPPHLIFFFLFIYLFIFGCFRFCAAAADEFDEDVTALVSQFPPLNFHLLLPCSKVFLPILLFFRLWAASTPN